MTREQRTRALKIAADLAERAELASEDVEEARMAWDEERARDTIQDVAIATARAIAVLQDLVKS